MTDDVLHDISEAELAAEPPFVALGDYRLDAAAYEALARRVEAAAAGELERRRQGAATAVAIPTAPARASTATGRASWRTYRRATTTRAPDAGDLAPVLARALRPALLAAAAAALLAVGLARQGGATGATGADAAGQQLSDATAVQALNLHDPSAQWVDQGHAPTVDALGRAIGLGGAP